MAAPPNAGFGLTYAPIFSQNPAFGFVAVHSRAPRGFRRTTPARTLPRWSTQSASGSPRTRAKPWRAPRPAMATRQSGAVRGRRARSGRAAATGRPREGAPRQCSLEPPDRGPAAPDVAAAPARIRAGDRDDPAGADPAGTRRTLRRTLASAVLRAAGRGRTAGRTAAPPPWPAGRGPVAARPRGCCGRRATPAGGAPPRTSSTRCSRGSAGHGICWPRQRWRTGVASPRGKPSCGCFTAGAASRSSRSTPYEIQTATPSPVRTCGSSAPGGSQSTTVPTTATAIVIGLTSLGTRHWRDSAWSVTATQQMRSSAGRLGSCGTPRKPLGLPTSHADSAGGWSSTVGRRCPVKVGCN